MSPPCSILLFLLPFPHPEGRRRENPSRHRICLSKWNLSCGRSNFPKHFSPKIGRGRKQWNGWQKPGSKVAQHLLFALTGTEGLGSFSSGCWEQGQCWEMWWNIPQPWPAWAEGISAALPAAECSGGSLLLHRQGHTVGFSDSSARGSGVSAGPSPR